IVTAMVASLTALPIAVLAPLSTLGPLPGNKLHHTFWGQNPRQRLARDHDGTPIKLSDVAMNSIFHVMPEDLTSEPPYHLDEREKPTSAIQHIHPNRSPSQPGHSLCVGSEIFCYIIRTLKHILASQNGD